MQRSLPVLAVALAVSLGAVPAARADPTVSASELESVDGSLVVRAHDLAALETPTALGPDARMVFIGDSVGGNVAAGIAAEADRRGAGVEQSTRAGCAPIDGRPVKANGSLVGSALPCEAARPEWLASVAATPADAVLWLSTYDAGDRLVGGVLVDPATPEGRVRTAELVVAAADVVAPPRSGRRVVFLLEAPHLPGAAPSPATVQSVTDVQRHRAILHLVVRTDPDRFSILNLERFLCPAGPPCPAEPAPGIQPRVPFNGHINPKGAAWLAPLILDALGVT
ncbi:MAG: SGNH hydrolase domain-containing protein [Acidimicrobiia bacterium]